MKDLLRRQQALEKTLARFRSEPFVLGRADCVQLARFHLRAMGHRKLPAAKGYSSPRGAMLALGKAIEALTGTRPDAPTLEQLFDAMLPRIAPAAMLPGDLALVPSQPGTPAWRAGTVVISVGRKWLSWWDGTTDTLAIVEPLVAEPFLAAWRA